jgi:O-antigen/teichoic acid export membrane protein
MRKKLNKLSNFLKNASWLFFEKAVYICLSFFVGFYIARYLGAYSYGLYTYAFSFTIVFGGFASLALNDIIVKRLVTDPQSEANVLGTSLILRLVISTLLTIISYFIGVSIHSSEPFLVIIIVLFVGQWIIDSFNILEYFYQAKTSSKYYASARVISLLLGAIIKICLIFSGASLIWFVFAVLLDAILKNIFLYVFYLKFPVRVSQWTFNKQVAIEMLSESWPLILASTASLLYLQIDTIMIKHLLDASAVGIYAVATRISGFCFYIPQILVATVFPHLLQVRSYSTILFQQRLQSLLEIMFWMAVATIIAVFFTADYLVNLVFGTEYAQSSSVLKIYILSAIPYFCDQIQSRWLITEGRQVISLVTKVAVLLINIILNIILIKNYGLIGGALATFISHLACYVFTIFLFNTKLNATIHWQAFSLFSTRKLLTKLISFAT